MLFRPTLALNTVLDITPEMLGQINVRALILDLDNTLTTHNNPKPADGVLDWIKNMRDNNIKLMIVSNNKTARVTPFADMLGLEFVPSGAKPLPKGFLKAVEKLKLPRNQICAVGDQIFTDILGANFAGIKSIFVFPIEPEPGTLFRIKRAVERPLLPKRNTDKKMR